jgi:hypothetical protein
MNRSQRKLALSMLAFCLTLAVVISPALAQAQATSSGTGSAQAKPAAPASPSAAPAAPKAATGAPSSSEIAAAKASGKVWVNTESGVYHKSGRWYGKTKAGKFMTEAEAKAAGYKAAHKE